MDLILRFCIVPMFRHPGCSFVEPFCPAPGVVNFIVASLLPMLYISPGVILLLLGEDILDDVLLSVAGHLYLSFSRSGSAVSILFPVMVLFPVIGHL